MPNAPRVTPAARPQRDTPTSGHRCHLDICTAAVPPARLFCLTHWRMVPKSIQKQVWATYRPGQEVDKHPSPEYMEAQRIARIAVLGILARRGCTCPTLYEPPGEQCTCCRAKAPLAQLMTRYLVTPATE